ncbi:MAG: protein translocase subunit SecF [Eubacteriaceae bacterium]|nr:protein translocase subunit SecF [Eubacteriaceae bacterium]
MKMKLNVTKNYKLFFIISIILTALSLGALLINGLNFGIDFVGGTIIQIDMHETFQTNDIKVFTDKFDEHADITYAGESKEELMISTQVSLTSDQKKTLMGDLNQKYGIEEKDLLSADNVSPTIGDELKVQALIAVGLAIILMLAYITFRFEFLFGLAAIIALFHDVIIVVGVYAVLGIQVNTPFIAAVLTILGYSINDTIVVFDRIRENKTKNRKYGLSELVDDSINQTIARSINTSLTTIIAITALYFVGVQSIKDFAFPMIVGFITGTYSSIFIASSFWFAVSKKKIAKIPARTR